MVVTLLNHENRTALELVGLTPLMERTSGSADIVVGVIDGPVWFNQPAFDRRNMHEVESGSSARCHGLASSACVHGTLVMGVLAAERSTGAPAICPSCSFLIRPIFSEVSRQQDGPSASVEELAQAIVSTARSGAQIINISAAITQPFGKGDRVLSEAFDFTAKRGVLVVVAAGNQGTIGSSAITSHPWVIPVVSTDLYGRPTAQSNLGSSIGRQGLSAPGDNITSLGPKGKLALFSGTSAAAAFVTGAIALLWSEFPSASSSQIRHAISGYPRQRRNTVVPPLLNARAAFQDLEMQHRRTA